MRFGDAVLEGPEHCDGIRSLVLSLRTAGDPEVALGASGSGLRPGARGIHATSHPKTRALA